MKFFQKCIDLCLVAFPPPYIRPVYVVVDFCMDLCLWLDFEFRSEFISFMSLISSFRQWSLDFLNIFVAWWRRQYHNLSLGSPCCLLLLYAFFFLLLFSFSVILLFFPSIFSKFLLYTCTLVASSPAHLFRIGIGSIFVYA